MNTTLFLLLGSSSSSQVEYVNHQFYFLGSLFRYVGEKILHNGLYIFQHPTKSTAYPADWVKDWRLSCHIVSHEPFTCVCSLVHGHRQLNDVIHPLCVLGFQWLLTHNPLLYQEPEGFGWVGPWTAIPLWVTRNDIGERLGDKERSRMRL